MKDNTPSATARFVATGIQYLATDARLKHEVPTRMAELNQLMLRTADTGRFSRAQSGIIQRLSIPGIYPHFVLRKRWIEKLASKAVAEGITQVVVLGAGLDTLSLRLGETYPHLHCLEIDHGATQRVKKKTVAAIGSQLVRPDFIELDLSRQTLQECLLTSRSYNPQARTLFVAEGLFMYLMENDVRAVFRFVREHSAPGSSIIFTFMEEQAPGNYQFGNESIFVKLWLKLKHETFLWGLPLDAINDYTQSNGLTLLSTGGEAEFRAELLAPEHRDILLAQGEYVAWAKVNP